jgi:hypothetical protein
MSECQITISDLQVVHSEREVYTRWFCAFLRSLEAYDQHVIAIFNYQEVYFWPSNYSQCLVLAIKPESQESSTIELLKPFTIGPWAVLVASFADVDSTCRWDPLVHLFYLFSLPPLFLLSSTLFLEHSSGWPPGQARGGAAGRAATLCRANVIGWASWISASGRRGRPSKLAAEPGELELHVEQAPPAG